jgi:hypothetical protein
MIPTIKARNRKKKILENLTAKGGTMRFIEAHIRRLFTEYLNLFFAHDRLFRAVGLLNGRLGLIKSVFMAYPATDAYRDAYTYPWRAKAMSWNPGLIGLFWQNGKIGLKFTVSNRDEEFLDQGNKEQLRQLVARMEEIRELLQAERKSFAGILPGILFRTRLIKEMPEADVTVEIVCKAIEGVKAIEGLSDDVPIIVLGGRGFVGQKVMKSLPAEFVWSVDTASGGKDVWPAQLKGHPALVVNISRRSALDEYVRLLWPQAVVVNEVYPEPSAETIAQLQRVGCRCYHIVGAKAGALPSFPGGYQGGIPCCAAWSSPDLVALFKRIA